MSILRWASVACDNCLNLFGAMDEMGDTGTEARALAARAGWTRRHIPGQFRAGDLCKECSELPADRLSSIFRA